VEPPFREGPVLADFDVPAAVLDQARELQESTGMPEAEARSREVLIEAMGRALNAIISRDANGFFEHCGFRVLGQPL
jgi:hypothetical protein